MARLFIRHKPTNYPVSPSTIKKECGVFNTFTAYLLDNGLQVGSLNNMDVFYVCIVHDGVCWAARSFYLHASGTRVRISCVPFNDDPSGQKMILADMILN